MWANAVDVAGPLTERLGAAARRAGPGSRSGSTSATQPPRNALEHAAVVRARRPPGPPPPQARADAPRAHLLGPGRRATTWAVVSRLRPPRRADLLGELHARRPPAAAPRRASTSTWPPPPTTATSGSPRCGPSPSRPARSCSRRCSTCAATTSPTTSRCPTSSPPAPRSCSVGDSVICDPWGNLLAGPVAGREEILYADCDLGAIIAAPAGVRHRRPLRPARPERRLVPGRAKRLPRFPHGTRSASVSGIAWRPAIDSVRRPVRRAVTSSHGNRGRHTATEPTR